VSVVTPSYNHGAFLEETIRSVLLQGYPDLEYVVLDAGSDDGSIDIIRRYAPWLAYWSTGPDQGQTRAVNAGWARASGGIVAYVNADDSYLPGALFAVADAFAASPQAGMVYGSAVLVDEAGRAIRTWQAEPFDVTTMLTSGNIVPQPATFFSRSAIGAVGALDEHWDMIMDYELCIRIGMRFLSVCVPDALATFRAHGDTKTQKSFDVMSREIEEFVRRFCLEHPELCRERSIERRALSRMHYELALWYFGQERYKALGHLARSIAASPRVGFGLIRHGLLVDYLRERANLLRSHDAG
jgi:glycosyltransferase involved in cell wall biosynthesis